MTHPAGLHLRAQACLDARLRLRAQSECTAAPASPWRGRALLYECRRCASQPVRWRARAGLFQPPWVRLRREDATASAGHVPCRPARLLGWWPLQSAPSPRSSSSWRTAWGSANLLLLDWRRWCLCWPPHAQLRPRQLRPSRSSMQALRKAQQASVRCHAALTHSRTLPPPTRPEQRQPSGEPVCQGPGCRSLPGLSSACRHDTRLRDIGKPLCTQAGMCPQACARVS